jgi:hypothetical protein
VYGDLRHMKGRHPGARTLANRLRVMLGPDGATGRHVEIIDRSPEPSSSTFPSEIVTCRIGELGAVRLLCKYSRPQRCQLPAWHVAHGHRHGTRYEAWVYRHVLEPVRMTTPRLWGTYEGRGERSWLVLEYLDGSMRIHLAPPGPESGAAWIGGFHARNEARVSEPALQFLSTYTADYYRGWARRTLMYARKFGRDYRRIESVCESFEQAIDVLLEPPHTVIHGEYYPSNVLWRPDGVYPVDWESAAIGAGEIDLACLTEHWRSEVVERCEEAYIRARWPAGCDLQAFAQRFSAARLYTLLRWAGTRRAWNTLSSRDYYVSRLTGEWDRVNARDPRQSMPLMVS